jgi:hypothetical protein
MMFRASFGLMLMLAAFWLSGVGAALYLALRLQSRR